MTYEEIQRKFNQSFGSINKHFEDDLEGIRSKDFSEEDRGLRGYIAAVRAGEMYENLLNWRDEQVRARREEVDAELFEAPSGSAGARFDATLERCINMEDDALRALAASARATRNAPQARAIAAIAASRGLDDVVQTAAAADPTLSELATERAALPDDAMLARAHNVRWSVPSEVMLRPSREDVANAEHAESVERMRRAQRRNS